MRRWIKVRSWHYVLRARMVGYRTRCGLYVGGSAPMADTLPLDERSCETCLRLTAANDGADVPGPNEPHA